MPSPPSQPSTWPSPVRALAHHNFRVYFGGQAVSILGSWIQQVALSWLVYRLTGSAALLGVTACAGLLPLLLVGPVAGAWVDRHDKRRVLIAVEGLMALQALALAALTALDWVTPPLLVAMAVLLGMLNAFETPLRQSLINSFVARKADLPNALALNAMLFNSGRFIAPPLAGLLLGLTSEAVCFALNGLSFLALMVGLMLMRIEAPPRAGGSVGDVFREGLAYARRTYPVRMLLILVATVNVTASSYAVLLPVFARDIFAGDARTLGWLWGAAGCGAFIATLLLALRRGATSMVPTVLGGVVCCATGMLAFAYGAGMSLAMLALGLVGGGIATCNVGVNITLQSFAPEHMRGRVMSLFSSARFGFEALGGLVAGTLAARFSASLALLLEGLVLTGFALWVLPRRQGLAAAVAAELRHS